MRSRGAARREPGSTRFGAQESVEERALAALYAEHSQVVRAFIRSFLADPHRGEDVLQETFLRAWRSIDRIRVTEGSARSYLFATARNILTDEWRSQERRPRLVHDDARLDAAPSDDSVDATLEVLTINEALSRLTEDHREVVQALYYDGLSVNEAADRLGLPPGTVKSRSYYAVRALRAAFDEMGLLR
jgi:RNA polymerase sigma-70 factor (ECF subfamily)